jgi:HAD superfamily hydrolase (TIGR01549 family)
MFGPIRAVFFDLDGTLVNSLPGVISSMRKIVLKLVGRDLSPNELVAAFGPPPQEVLAVFVPKELHAEAWKLWDESLETLTREDCVPFPGIEPLLNALKIPFGIVTGRDRRSAIQILNALGWWGTLFQESNLIAGDDEWGSKPDPRGLVELCKRAGVEPGSALYVGDHAVDAKAARLGGLKFAAALWDLEPGHKTHRSAYKSMWTRWDQIDQEIGIDLRLAKPEALTQWLVVSHSQTK